MCTIVDVRIEGFDVGPAGRPTRYVVTGTVEDCKTVLITVRSGDATGPLIHKSGDVGATPTGTTGTSLVRHEFATLAAHDVGCGRPIWVRIECTKPPACSLDLLADLECPDLGAPEIPDLDTPPPEEITGEPTVVEPVRTLPTTIGSPLPNPLCRPLRQFLALCLALLIVCLIGTLCAMFGGTPAFLIPWLVAAILMTLGLMWLLRCRLRGCSLWRVIAWAGKWGTVVSAVLSLICFIGSRWLALPMIVANLLVGIATGILILWMDDHDCEEPQARGWP